jgi:hypothetical protein
MITPIKECIEHSENLDFLRWFADNKQRLIEMEKLFIKMAAISGFNQAHYQILHPETFPAVECTKFADNYYEQLIAEPEIKINNKGKSWASIERKYGKYLKK